MDANKFTDSAAPGIRRHSQGSLCNEENCTIRRGMFDYGIYTSV